MKYRWFLGDICINNSYTSKFKLYYQKTGNKLIILIYKILRKCYMSPILIFVFLHAYTLYIIKYLLQNQ
jgi:hypothetical protein